LAGVLLIVYVVSNGCNSAITYTSASIASLYVLAIAVLLVGTSNLIIGVKRLTQKDNKKKLFSSENISLVP